MERYIIPREDNQSTLASANIEINNIPTDMAFRTVTDDVLTEAHSTIVASASSTLRTMLKGNSTDPVCTSAAVKLISVEHCSAIDFQEIMHFMYGKRAVLNVQNVTSILMVANCFQLQELERYCIEFIAEIRDCKNK